MGLHGASAGSFPRRSIARRYRTPRIPRPARRSPTLRFSLVERRRLSRDMPASHPTRLAIVALLIADARLLGTCSLGAWAEMPLVHVPRRHVQSALAPRFNVQPQRLPNPRAVVAHDGEGGCQLIVGETCNRSALLILNRGPFAK
jgi:hypothetical protein